MFWDMQMGSDGVQACASCHFHAGADHRIKNALNPGTNANPALSWFSSDDFNYTLQPGDYPFHKFSDATNKNSAVLYDQAARTGSQGVFLFKFLSVIPGSSLDNGTIQFDDTFQIGGANIRRVEPRNTPTSINAVFNHRNFWDGRASFNFNGQSPFGLADTNAAIMVNNASLTPTKIVIPYSSLASQAVGPMLSKFEMSYDVRVWPNMGKKLLNPAIKPLAKQTVSAADSVLGGLAVSGTGLNTTYRQLIQTAFKPQYWNNTSQIISLDVNGNPVIKSGTPMLTTDFTQIEYNLSFFFGLAVQAYEQTLVSDDSRYDKAKDATPTAYLSTAEQAGLKVFMGTGKCIACHSGAEFTSASVSHIFDNSGPGVVERMVMSDGSTKLYDTGFYNTTVRADADDIGLGGTDPFGNPLALSRLAKQKSPLIAGFGFPINPSNFEVPGPIVSTEPDAVDGSFKTPTLRNIDLTGPYMHNGGEATLEDVVAFYNRGGNFFNNEKHPDISSLGLTPDDQTNLVTFMKTLTDDRVRYEKAPFDHPQLWVPNGHPYNPDGSLMLGSNAKGRDVLCEIPAVGAAGGPALQTYGQLLNSTTADSFGSLGHTLSNCVPQAPPSDTTPPVMTFMGIVNGKPTISALDNGSGLSSILVTTSTNANVTVPEITGQTNAVNVTYTKVNTSQSATVALQATDVAGNVSIFDPWDITINRNTGAPVMLTDQCPADGGPFNCKPGDLALHPYYEHFIYIKNDPANGLKNLRVVVNGIKFEVAGLRDGETRTLDIKSAMKTNNKNIFQLEALGKPGGSAYVVFYGPN